MRFFRKKDKRKEQPLGLPGFGGGDKHNGDGKRKPSGSSPQYSGSAGGAATHAATAFRPMATHRSASVLLSLPAQVLDQIFAFVCPHATDHSYQTCEESGAEDACMLCDLRDLAHCVAVCKKWRAEAIKLLCVYTLCTTPPWANRILPWLVRSANHSDAQIDTRASASTPCTTANARLSSPTCASEAPS